AQEQPDHRLRPCRHDRAGGSLPATLIRRTQHPVNEDLTFLVAIIGLGDVGLPLAVAFGKQRPVT
ncbi:hypothetical protein, partial [Lamprobacter modestohalophilus]|uniref:hypothetical protein n=1 Tax=Lamprobacter modestohalophilus TaxID=1064514 RepID=UPI001A9257C4